MKTIRVMVFGIALVLAACAQVAVRSSASGEPAAAGSGSRIGAGLSGTGFRQVSGPSPVRNGATSISVSSTVDLAMFAFMARKGETGGSILVPIERSGTGVWTLKPSFSQVGTYVITLLGKPANDPGNIYTLLAEWTVIADSVCYSTAETNRSAPPETSSISIVKTVEDPAPRHADSSVPALLPQPKSVRPEAARSALEAFVAAGDVSGIRTCLDACLSRDGGTSAAYKDALESILFESERGRMKEISGLLEAAGLDPNWTDKDGWTLLQDAVSFDRLDVAAWLLQRGADVNARTIGSLSALHVLSSDIDNPVAPDMQAEWVRLFLRYGLDLNARSDSGRTALCIAALSDRQHELVKALVESGADINLGDEEGNAPLSHATQHGQTENAAYLKAKGARLYSYEFPVANDAAPCRGVLAGDLAAVRTIPKEDFGKMLARTSMDIPATPLHLAAEQGSLGVLEALCARKVDWNVPDRYGRSPLQLAVLADRWDAASLLLDNGADPHFETLHHSTPFIAACASKPNIALQMLDKGVAPRGSLVASAAIGSESLELVKALGNRVEWNREALSNAVNLGLVEITEYLAARVDLNGERPSNFVDRARENRRLFLAYEAKAFRPIEGPRRAGGIADKRGAFPYIVESWSPWMSKETVQLSDCPVGVYVPKSYDGKRPFGLVVSMTNAKSSSPYPRDFAATLDRHDLIWVGFDPYKNLDGANTEFCLALVYNMLGYYNIDQSRIYIGGYSYGGQLTDLILSTQPWLFDGAFFINMAHSQVSRATPETAYRKHCMPIVIVEGDYDYLRNWAYQEYEALCSTGYPAIYFAHEPMKGHRLISAANFERIISLLEAGGR